MKKILTLLLVGSVIFTACKKEDPKITTPEDETGADVTTEVDQSVTFTDTDDMATSREWSVSPATGVTMPGDLTQSSVDLTFTEAGNYTVTSTRMFPSNYTQPNNKLTFSVEVLDKVASVIEIMSIRNDGTDGAAFTMDNNAENVISSGQSIRVSNSSMGEPSKTTVTFTGSNAPAPFDIAVGATVEVPFPMAGTYGMTVTSTRTVPAGSDEVTYTGLVKVVAPLVLADIVVNDKNTIALHYTKKLDASTLTDATYTVDYSNFGTTGTLAASAVALEAAPNDSIVLVTVEDIFTSDSLFIDYSGNIADAVDGALADNFTDYLVDQALNYNGTYEKMYIEEDGTTLNSWPFSTTFFFGITPGKGHVLYDGNEYSVVSNWGPIVTELIGANATAPFDGIAGGYFVNGQVGDVTDMATGGAGSITLEKDKTYKVSVRINVLQTGQWDNPTTGLEQSLISLFCPFVNGWGDILNVKLDDHNGDGWVEVSNEFTVTAIEDGSNSAATYMFLRVAGFGEVLTDNIHIAEVQKR